jgi:hypothetical protein
MTKQFQALPMSWQCAETAYPLVYMHDASISLADWLRFARRRDRTPSEPAGLIAIRDCRGIIHALFSYRVDIDVHGRKRLQIGDLIVAHLPGLLIDDAIDVSAGKLAADLGCESISIEQPFIPRIVPRRRCPTAERLSRQSWIVSNLRHH